MIVLDTNVLSELIKITPSPQVVEWCNSYPEVELYLTSITQADAQIAAIARAYGAVIATRNTSDFEHCGVKVVNPWG